ncbi:MAG: tripartite tricarboxylate transporter TctB family protein [Alphaproteobacteria bacterium]|nr:tripartite tricarboxylate transporter TctB family protein [Alphaproteobacteria bacterium]
MIRINQDVAAALLFIAFGAVGLYVAWSYPVGTAVRMGPGYVPRLLCWAMIGLGVLVGLKGLGSSGVRVERWAWFPLILLSLAVLAFAGLIERAGLVAATLALVLIGARAGHEFKFAEVGVLAVFLAIGSVLLFKTGLGLPMVGIPGIY